MKLKPSIVFAFMVAICATPLSAVSSDGGSLDQARSEPPVQTANGVGDSGPPGLSDAEIVMWASRKITMFRQMLKATGMSDALIQSTLDN